MTVIAFVGRQGSGKSTASRVLGEKGFDVLSMGDVMRKEAERRGIEPTEEGLGSLSEEIRKEGGMGAVADLLLENEELDGDVVIDGIRGAPEVEVFREGLDDFFLVAVTAPEEQRFDRVKSRGRRDDVRTKADFVEKESREDEWGLQEALEEADTVIENDSSLRDFREDVERIPALAAEVKVSAEVKVTETLEGVKRSVGNLFPTIAISSYDGKVGGEGRGKDLEHFRKRVFEQRIIDTARKELEAGRSDSRTVVHLDKQAAWVDRVNFDVGSALGTIKVEISGYLDDVVEWIAPPTEKGEPLGID